MDNKSSLDSAPLARWRHYFTLAAILVATFSMLGIWYGNLSAKNRTDTLAADNVERPVQGDRPKTAPPSANPSTECSVIVKDVTGESTVNLDIGESVCNR